MLLAKRKTRSRQKITTKRILRHLIFDNKHFKENSITHFGRLDLVLYYENEK